MSAEEVATRIVVDLLVRRQYETIEAMTRGKRLDAEELRRAVVGYGKSLSLPGPGWWQTVEIGPMGAGGALHVAAPLWTDEEGRSDLTLELRLVEIGPGVYETEIEDLHVL